jgi:hypothetical protein
MSSRCMSTHLCRAYDGWQIVFMNTDGEIIVANEKGAIMTIMMILWGYGGEVAAIVFLYVWR